MVGNTEAGEARGDQAVEDLEAGNSTAVGRPTPGRPPDARGAMEDDEPVARRPL